MIIDILTLFPKELEISLHGALKRADIRFVNIRDFSHNNYRSVDDRQYGGGKGMILKCQPIFEAIQSVKDEKLNKREQKVILLDPSGKKYNQVQAKKISKLKHIILVCGHYEGVDQRIKDFLVDEVYSIGDYILTGGEYPALVLADSVVRLLPGVLKEEVTDKESFSGKNPILEYPQYTRPDSFNGHRVPKVLLSGNYKEIQNWREEEAKKITSKLRPDLLKI